MDMVFPPCRACLCAGAWMNHVRYRTICDGFMTALLRVGQSPLSMPVHQGTHSPGEGRGRVRLQMKRAPEGNSAGPGWMRPDPIRRWIRGHRLLCLFGYTWRLRSALGMRAGSVWV